MQVSSAVYAGRSLPLNVANLETIHSRHLPSLVQLPICSTSPESPCAMMARERSCNQSRNSCCTSGYYSVQNSKSICSRASFCLGRLQGKRIYSDAHPCIHLSIRSICAHQHIQPAAMADEKIEPATHHHDPVVAEHRGHAAHVDLNKNLDAK